MTDLPISKSQKKRDMLRLQTLGEALVALKPQELAQFTLGDTLLNAVQLAKRTTSHEALRRQKQFIGKLMRHEDTHAIEAKLSAIKTGHEHRTREAKQLEILRDSLVYSTDNLIPEAIAKFPKIDKPKLKQLVKRARHEQSHNLPPQAKRALLKLLREERAHQQAETAESEATESFEEGQTTP